MISIWSLQSWPNWRADASQIMPDVLFSTRSEQLATLSLRHAVPAIYEYRPFVAAGGLISYGSDETEYYRLVGTYTGKILKGEKPAGLPVVQSTKVELIINLKTAKALGINVPLSLLGRADEVIGMRRPPSVRQWLKQDGIGPWSRSRPRGAPPWPADR